MPLNLPFLLSKTGPEPMLRLLISLVVLSFALLPAKASDDTCVTSAPNGQSLRVYDSASTNSPVLGGIGVGTCGIQVTNQCEGTMCVIVLAGLNGWVDMQHISNSPVVAPGLMSSGAAIGSYVYGVTGGSGSVTAAGRTQPTPVDANGEVRVQKTGPSTATLTLPQEVTPGPIPLSGNDAGPWTGGFGSWGGMPMAVTVTFNGLGAQTATLELKGNNQLAAMTIRLDLAARSLPEVQQSGRPAPATPSPAGSSFNACSELDRLTKEINSRAGTKQIQDMRSIYVISAVKSTEPTADQAACQKALDLISQDAGLWVLVEEQARLGPAAPPPPPGPVASQQVRPSTVSAPRPTPQPTTTTNQSSQHQSDPQGLLAQSCSILQPLISPLLRGGSRAEREQVLALLTAQGLVSVSSAQPVQCALILADLMSSGLIANDNRPWAAIAQSGAPGFGGEDPATMIAGGREIGIDPSDFIPEFNPDGQAANPAPPPQPTSPSSAGDPCILLGNALVIAVRVGFPGDLSAFADLLKTHGVETLAPASAPQCLAALNNARQAGLAR